MRKEDVAPNLSSLAFDTFYWFSRFEFALKENAYLQSHDVGANAEPGWDDFVKKWQGQYIASAEALALLAAKPERQVVAANDELKWQAVGLADCKSELARVVRLLKTVRNNLFHGGKPLGTVSPRIKVQIKHREASASVQGCVNSWGCSRKTEMWGCLYRRAGLLPTRRPQRADRTST